MIPRILRAGLDDWETVQQLTEMVRKAAEEGLVLMKVWVSGGGRTREEEHKKSPEDRAIVHSQNTITELSLSHSPSLYPHFLPSSLSNY